MEESGQNRLRERMDSFCARAILVVVLFILAWGPLAFGGMDATAFLVIQGATALALAFHAGRERKPPPLPPRFRPRGELQPRRRDGMIDL